MTKILIRGGVVISMDQAIGILPQGDLLIEGDKILAVGRKLDQPEATVVDASGKIVIPGLINAHIHTWQTAIRTLGGNWAGSDYFNYVHANLAARYTPADSYISTLVGALSQIDSGTTTIFDWCHNNTTPAHTDAAIDGLVDAGVRAVFGHGTVKPKPQAGAPHFSQIPHPASEIKRLREGRLASDSGLITLAVGILGPDYATLEVCRHDFNLAREYDLLSSAHVWGRANRLVPEGYRRIAQEGLLGPKHNVVHANYIEDDELNVIVNAGASITATPPVELRGHVREPLVGRVAMAGGNPSIGTDSEIFVTGEMFAAMRLTLQGQRLFDNLRTAQRISMGEDAAAMAYAKQNLSVIGSGGSLVETTSVTTREALEWATINNARALGLADVVGSLTPGKQADIVLVRQDDLNLIPAHNALDAIVMFAQTGNVDTVFIAGKKVKEDGRLLRPDSDMSTKKNQLIESGRRLIREGGVSALTTSCLPSGQRKSYGEGMAEKIHDDHSTRPRLPSP